MMDQSKALCSSVIIAPQGHEGNISRDDNVDVSSKNLSKNLSNHPS